MPQTQSAKPAGKTIPVNSDAYDIMTLRIRQALGIVESLMANYHVPKDEMRHVLSPGYMLSALDAVSELLEQAKAARPCEKAGTVQ